MVPEGGFRPAQFLHLSVSHSVHRGVSADTPWANTPMSDAPLPPEMATAAGGTYPTEMHSCLSSLFAVESQLQFICTRLKCVSVTRGFIPKLKRETVKICNNMAINLTYLLCGNNAVVRKPLMGNFS